MHIVSKRENNPTDDVTAFSDGEQRAAPSNMTRNTVCVRACVRLCVSVFPPCRSHTCTLCHDVIRP